MRAWRDGRLTRRQSASGHAAAHHCPRANCSRSTRTTRDDTLHTPLLTARTAAGVSRNPASRPHSLSSSLVPPPPFPLCSSLCAVDRHVVPSALRRFDCSSTYSLCRSSHSADTGDAAADSTDDAVLPQAADARVRQRRMHESRQLCHGGDGAAETSRGAAAGSSSDETKE